MNQLARPAERTTAETTTRAPSRGPQWVIPQANLREEKDGYCLELDMPGVSKEGLEITVEANELTIFGHRLEPEVKADVVYRESRPNDYRRTFDLDPSINTAKISAKIDQGLVTVMLPIAESVKPRKITVTE
jgi:HSP20 family protein